MAAIIAMTVVAGLVAGSDVLHGRIVAAISLAEPVIASHPVGGALLFLVLAALSAILVFFSGLVIVPVGVQAWGEIGCGLLLWGGWSLGGALTYWLGRRFGRPMVDRFVPAAAIDRYQAKIPRNGSLLTALLIQLALPSDVSGYFFGLMGYPAYAYFGGLVLAELPYALGTVFLGGAFMQGRSGLLLSVAVVAAVLMVFAWLRRERAG
jgi:uncharacterized membrane protein YdjX (TVP38/TMEM64 family)